MKRVKELSKEKNSLALNAAALQDHLLRKNNFKLDDGKPLSFKRSTISSTVTHQPNPSRTSTRPSGLFPPIPKIKTTNSILPYQSDEVKKLKEQLDEQTKVAKYKQKLTLAQRLGLISAPPPPLSAAEWQKIQNMSKKRKDSENVCSICLEDFKLSPQMILSCSHVFHKVCMDSFQRHNKMKACPICRRKDYEKKFIDEGIRLYTMKCIITIQRILRGSNVRRWLYEKLVKQGYKATSKLFNRRVLGYKMWKLSNRIHQRIKLDMAKYKQFLSQVETDFKKNNEELFEDIVQYQRSKIKNTEQLNSYLAKLDKLSKPAQQKQQASMWASAKQKALQRQDQTCSICLMGLFSKKVYLLSCSHMFHVNCINSFQRYSVPNNICPCCRSHYDKKIIELPKN